MCNQLVHILTCQCIDSTSSGSPPFVSFGDVSIRDLWYRLVKELLAGMCLVLGELCCAVQNFVVLFSRIS